MNEYSLAKVQIMNLRFDTRSFTVLWSVFIRSSGRPFKGALVGRPETL